MSLRVDLRAILTDPAQRRELMVRTLIATQAREDITTTREQAEAAYDKVQREIHGMSAFRKLVEDTTAQLTEAAATHDTNGRPFTKLNAGMKYLAVVRLHKWYAQDPESREDLGVIWLHDQRDGKAAVQWGYDSLHRNPPKSYRLPEELVVVKYTHAGGARSADAPKEIPA